jgi:hypothetical protein
MDLKDIEEWGRELLQTEAAKRGMKNPEVYSTAALVQMILKHDYGAPRNVREAARLIGGIIGSAKNVLRGKLSDSRESGARVRTYVGAAKKAHEAAQHFAARSGEQARDAVGTWADADSGEPRGLSDAEQAELREEARVRAEERDTRRDSERVRAEARARDAERARPEPGWHEVPIASSIPREFVGAGEQQSEANSAVSEPNARDSKVVRTGASDSRDAVDRSLQLTAADPLAADSSHDSGVRRAPAGTTDGVSVEDAAHAPHLRLVEAPAAEFTAPAPSPQEVFAETKPEIAPWTPPKTAPEAATVGVPTTEHISYGPHPQDGLHLRWSVTPEGIDRARKVLGDKGELAVRIVAVSVEPHAIVKTNVIDYGPVSDVGDWTAPLLPTEARYVSAIGLRTTTQFVSIVHSSS